jgi:hypothetical protein
MRFVWESASGFEAMTVDKWTVLEYSSMSSTSYAKKKEGQDEWKCLVLPVL